MFTQPQRQPTLQTRKQTAEEVNRVLARFPMIVDILGVLGKAQVPFPGDAEIRHGCERALTAMLLELARIEPAPPGKTTKTEELALQLLDDRTAARLIDADQLQRIHHFIERILCTPQQHH
jgi:hypothetical protein